MAEVAIATPSRAHGRSICVDLEDTSDKTASISWGRHRRGDSPPSLPAWLKIVALVILDRDAPPLPPSQNHRRAYFNTPTPSAIYTNPARRVVVSSIPAGGVVREQDNGKLMDGIGTDETTPACSRLSGVAREVRGAAPRDREAVDASPGCGGERRRGGVIPRETAFEGAAQPHVAKASLRQRRAVRGWHSRYCGSMGRAFCCHTHHKKGPNVFGTSIPSLPLPPPPLSPCSLQPSKNEEDDALRCGDPTPLLRRSYRLGHNRWLACPKASDLNGTQVMSRYAIPQWEISGFVEYIESGHKQGDMLLVVPEGAYAVRLGNEASIKQKLKVVKGMYYSITFSAARTCAQDERLNVSVTPDTGLLPIQTTYGSDGWDSYAWAFRAAFEEVLLVIHNPGVEEDPACGPLIDSLVGRADRSVHACIDLLWSLPLGIGADNLLKNRDFEEGPYVLPNTTWGVLIPPNIEDDHSPLPGWTVESLKAVKYIDSDHFSVPRGKRAVELVAGKESALAQVARTVPGKLYALAFSIGDGGNGCVGSMVVEAFAGRGTAKIPYESKGTGGYKRGVLRFTAVEERTRVVFLSTFYHTKVDGSLCGPVLDDVSLLSIRSPAPRH
ncbi:hypothetical protein BHE74_00049490 [Ensete ventricosum]|nr:hypothetical protein BHE74_00049490 [Ensete ventricosum]